MCSLSFPGECFKVRARQLLIYEREAQKKCRTKLLTYRKVPVDHAQLFANQVDLVKYVAS